MKISSTIPQPPGPKDTETLKRKIKDLRVLRHKERAMRSFFLSQREALLANQRTQMNELQASIGKALNAIESLYAGLSYPFSIGFEDGSVFWRASREVFVEDEVSAIAFLASSGRTHCLCETRTLNLAALKKEALLSSVPGVSLKEVRQIVVKTKSL